MPRPGWKSPSPHRPPGRAGHNPSPPGRPARCSCTHRHRATPRAAAQGEAPSATPFGFAPPKRKGKLSYTVTALLHKLHSFQSKLVWCVVYPMICLSLCLFLNWRVLSAFSARDGARGGGGAGPGARRHTHRLGARAETGVRGAKGSTVKSGCGIRVITAAVAAIVAGPHCRA